MTKKHSKATWQSDSTWWPTLDINNLAHFPNVHQIPIVLQCLIISWEEAIIVRGEATGIQLKTFIKTLSDNLWENNLAQKRNFSCCSAAILFPVRQMHIKDNFHWQHRWLRHKIFSGNSSSCAAKTCRHCQRHNGPRYCFYNLNYLSSYKAGKFTRKENSS